MVKEKIIFLVTHGETTDNSDPAMTPEGLERVKNLKEDLNILLPAGPAEIHCGTGRRQWQVVEALGFAEQNVKFSDVWGGPATLVKKEADGKKMVLLSYGKTIQYNNLITAKHLQPILHGIIAELPHDVLICSGRPILVRLGLKVEECKSGAIYQFIIYNDNSIEIKLTVDGVVLHKG